MFLVPTAIVGTTMLVLALLAGAAGFGFGLARRQLVARRAVIGANLALLAAGAMLLVALLTSDFRYEYVVQYSSRDLPTAYKFAAFWAGQAGSVLLWTMLCAAVAWRLAVSRDGLEQAAATPVIGIVAGMVILLLLRSPFAVEMAPEDGNGLNPLLQNPWMCVHPPVLFLGYALLAAPFAMAFHNLRDGDPHAWLAPARRYLLAGWVALGAGMMLGGYWAYITLGWGGFWAWDPVENASLIPWLVATCLLHGMAVQMRAGSLRRTNLVFAAALYGTIIYGSYLTRSGALANASVHNFESLGADYNVAWLAMLFVPLVAFAAVQRPRWRGLIGDDVGERQAWLVNGVWVLLAMTVLVLIGTSKPLFGPWFNQQGGVEQSFYNLTQSVLFCAVALTLLLQLMPSERLFTVWLAIGAALGTAAAHAQLPGDMPARLRTGLLTLAACSAAMIVVALHRCLHGLRTKQSRGVGAGLAHAGVALMVLGAVLSGPGQRTAAVVLEPGKQGEKLGHAITLTGIETRSDGATVLTFEADGRTARAVMRKSSHGEVREPALVHHAWGDLYLEPVALEEAAAGSTLVLAKGESHPLGEGTLTFNKFQMGGSHGEGGMSVGAALEYTEGGKKTPLVPKFQITADGNESPPVALGSRQIALTMVMPDTGQVELTVTEEGGPPGAKHLTLQVTQKPHIALVWLGTILCLGGGAWCLRGSGAAKRASEF